MRTIPLTFTTATRNQASTPGPTRGDATPTRELTLAGTLLADRDGAPGPVAVLISGSGPIDRDSNTRRQRIDVMGQIAAHLASVGIASFRYDKRGVGQSAGSFHATGFHDNVADAQAAVGAVLARPEVDPGQVYVIGHSEGALIAAELAAADPTLAGAVVLAGPAADGETVLRWQGERISASLPGPVKRIIGLLRIDLAAKQMKGIDKIKASTTDTIRLQLAKINAKWFREFLVHDPVPSLQAISVPVLAVTGAKDLQVDPAHAERICELVAGPCTSRIIPDLSHILRRDPGPASIRDYKRQIKEPVDAELLEIVSSWIGTKAPVTQP